MLVDNTSDSMIDHGKKRKKRSFIQKQKRFAKRGSYGRGTQLSQDMYEYFINIMSVMNTKKDDEEEMGILASNVFNEIDGKEAEYCCNQIVSRAVENLLPFSSDDEFSKFLDKFGENLRPIFCNAFGSHVLQQTLIIAFTKYQKVSKDSDNKLSIKFCDYILRIANFLFNNLDDFIWDIYSNAVAKTVFNVLSGHPVKGEIKLGLEHSDESEVDVPSEFNAVIKKYIKRILSWPQFNDLCNQTINSSFLQSLLLASRKLEESSEIVHRIISFYETSPLDLTDEMNNPFVRLLEVVLSVCKEDEFKKIYKLMFKENLVELSVSKNANFAVQKLILNCKSRKIFEKIFAKLGSHLEEVLKVKHSGVLLALVKGSRSLEVLQGDCMSMLMRTFQAKDTKEIVPLVCSLTPSEKYDPDTATVTHHGSLVIQELLQFKKPINVVNSLLELSDGKLVKLLSDVKGSHITDAFVRSPYIGEKSRDRLFKKLRGHYVELGTSKHGSRSLDAVWSVINVQQKALIAEELKVRQSELCGEAHGKGFARKIHLDNYRRDKDEWMRLQKSSATAEKYFSDIIPGKKRKIF